MKILVIGSKGYIGSNYCKALIKKGIKPWICDITPNLEKDPNYVNATETTFNLKSFFKNNKFDVCLNASGSGSVAYSLIHPYEDFSLNTVNVANILEAIKTHQPNCKFLNISSAAVYGQLTTQPLKEDMLTEPCSPYGVHKSMAEQLCKEYYVNYNIPTCSIRVFSVYGPGLCKQLFWDLFKKSKNDIGVIEMMGTGEETRDFIYINDLINAIELIIQNAGFKADVINVASGQTTKIQEATSLLLKYLNPTTKIRFNNLSKKGDPIHLSADITQLKSMGFKANTSIDDGLKEYAKWLKKNHL